MKDYIKTPGAAAYIHRKPNTLERWRTFGIGPKYYSVNGHALYTYEDLDEYVESFAVQPNLNAVNTPPRENVIRKLNRPTASNNKTKNQTNVDNQGSPLSRVRAGRHSG